MTLLNSDLDTFKSEFEAGLSRMLKSGSLGAFILALANSMQDRWLAEGLADKLGAAFATLSKHYAQGSLSGGADDLVVFEQMLPAGIDNYRAWEIRETCPWQCAFNPLRALKPERASNVPFETLQQPFSEDRFHFDKPFLAPEILVEEHHNGSPLRILYQKFPFVPYHLLILPDAESHLPQFLTRSRHAQISTMVKEVSETLPGFGIGYNSIGAGASVNHQHFHGFIEQTLPVELDWWSHNNGDDRYPVACEVFDNRESSWARIAERHAADQPYNLIYRANRVYFIPRPAQANLDLPPWLSNVTWFELAGCFNLVDRSLFEELTGTDIDDALSRLS